MDRRKHHEKSLQKTRKKTYECKTCGKEFPGGTGKYRYCSDKCRQEADNARNIIWYHLRGGKEQQKKYKEERRDEINTNHRNYIAKNRDYWNAKANESHKIQRDLKKMMRIVREQERLLQNADFTPVDDEKRNRWTELHIIRETISTFTCMDCGNLFVLTKNDSGIVNILKARLEHGKGNPCPYCGSAALNVHRYNTVESELAERYQNFTARNIRPKWMEGMELDLYDPERHVAIEFNGIIWHSNYKKDRPGYHKHKADLCEANGVQLIQIFETEWVNRKEQVLDKLDAIFHRDMTRINARKLQVKVMESLKERTAVGAFMDANHIQGASTCMWAVALMDGDEIVACCTFKYGTGYAAGGQAEGTGKYWELNRYATKLNTVVRGGLSRCIKAFERSHPEVHNIVSFADRRWTCPTRSAYSSSGFVETGRAEPNYQYTDLRPSHGLRNKQYMRKSAIESRALKNPEGPEAKVFSWDKTEQQMAAELGFYKIYDAGKIRYEMQING